VRIGLARSFNEPSREAEKETTTLSDVVPEPSTDGRVVLDARDISRALTRISHEILERNRDAEDLVLLGLHARGVPLAKRVTRSPSARST
jgi:hypothetical protein